MSVAVIVLDAVKLAEQGVLETGEFKQGKLSWSFKTPRGPQNVALRYSVDTTNALNMSIRLEYRVTLVDGRAEDMSYRVPLRYGFEPNSGQMMWAFICPSMKKTVLKLALHPGDRFFIGDMRSLVTLETPEGAEEGAPIVNPVTPPPSFASSQAPVAAPAPQPRPVAAPRPAQPPAPPPAAPRPAPSPAAAPIVAPSEGVLAQFARALKENCESRDIVVQEGKLDNFLRFGLQMFLLGAANGLASLGRVDRGQTTPRLVEAMKAMGLDGGRIPDLVKREEEYLSIPKYALMMQLGEDAVHAFINKETSLSAKFGDALSKWRNRIEIKNESSQQCFMFTDIVQSVQFTQANGDAILHDLVTAHNNVVRAALRANAGREVKHTGDGIMAVFDRASDGIACSIQIQRDIRRHNAANGVALPLKVRIGLNAGEARVENNDYLGLAVQLAARVCAAAQGEEILVSATVKELAAGVMFAYENHRELSLKGFAEAKPVSSVVWSE